MFIFRDVIAAIPDIVSGKASIVREELVPFFNFSNEFWGEGTSDLTSSEEVRVDYSFWTAWVRYAPVLPFALILMNALSAFILFYAFHRIGRYFYGKSLFGVGAALLSAFLIHMILLYAKVAHFYVLIIGFSMFALSISLLCEQLFFRRKLTKKNIAAVSLLTLLNPAIHYHVIFYVVAVLVIVIQLAFTLIMSRKVFWKYLRRNSLYFLLLIVFSLVPYVIYILATNSSELSDVSTQIPVNYWMIYYASLGLPFIFSLDTAGHLDLMRHGNYIAPIPRFGSMIVTGLIGALFIFKRWGRQHIVQKLFILTLFLIMLFAMWMTLGYSDNSPYSFHKVFGDIAIFFAGLGNGIGSTIAHLMGVFINILRFPHRFQFIYYYAVGILFMIALVWLRQIFIRRLRPVIATILVVIVGLFPILANNDYRAALTSGDLASFATPYYIPNDLKNIKQQLADKPGGKMFILPTLESGREIVQDGQRYSFIDKYLIYYLNYPTLYYGVGGGTDNKLVSYLTYRSIAYGEKWWQDVLANDLGITDILVPKHTEPRQQGITYLPGIDSKIFASLDKSTKYEKTYAGNDYELYSLKKPLDSSSSTLVDLSWKNMMQHFNDDRSSDSAVSFPLQIKNYAKADGDKKLVTDNIERSFYDLYCADPKTKIFVPRPVSLPFNSRYVASTNFTNNALSLSTLYDPSNQYNYLQEDVPELVNLQRPSFIGLKKGDVTLDMNLDIPQDGDYRLLLHAGSKGDTITGKFGDREVQFNKIAGDRAHDGDYVDFSYFYADVHLQKGQQTVMLQNRTENSIIIDSLALMPRSDIPANFDEISTSSIGIKPTDKDNVYDVTLRGYGHEK